MEEERSSGCEEEYGKARSVISECVSSQAGVHNLLCNAHQAVQQHLYTT